MEQLEFNFTKNLEALNTPKNDTDDYRITFVCPDCGGKLIKTGGCMECGNRCGFSVCG